MEVKLQLVFLQDPVMPSQEPPPEDKSEDELADVHGEDTDGSETSFCSHMFTVKESCSGQTDPLTSSAPYRPNGNLTLCLCFSLSGTRANGGENRGS